jgi:hypothetical protein
MYKQDLAAPMHMEAIQILPESSFSVVPKKRVLIFLNCEVKLPFSSTSENLFIMFSLGILTWSKVRAALSTPFYPILKPMSTILTPGISFIDLSRIGTRKAATPSF